ncbi:MAG: phosphatase PAP2 family protein [Rhizomicrobium sp.]
MLLWAGILLIIAGLGCMRIDRRAAHYFYDHIGGSLLKFLRRTTHLAKAAHWLTVSVLIYLAAAAVLRWHGPSQMLQLARDHAAAYILGLALGTLIAHTIKLGFGRRRPRDEMEMGLYGFKPFSFDTRYNSFPSGHSLTIFLVAVSASALMPWGAPVWFAAALWLSLTRALLTAHFLSDVGVGAGFGLISAHIIFTHIFPALSLSWF